MRVSDNTNEIPVAKQELAHMFITGRVFTTVQGALVINETGDRKDGHHTAHVERQYPCNVGKIENGVVSVSSPWADEDVYYPLDVEPYTLESYSADGNNDPEFQTKP